MAGDRTRALAEYRKSVALNPGNGIASSALATLRVSVRQAIYLTAADNFAREIRVLARPPGDHSRAGGSTSASAILD